MSSGVSSTFVLRDTEGIRGGQTVPKDSLRFDGPCIDRRLSGYSAERAPFVFFVCIAEWSGVVSRVVRKNGPSPSSGKQKPCISFQKRSHTDFLSRGTWHSCPNRMVCRRRREGKSPSWLRDVGISEVVRMPSLSAVRTGGFYCGGYVLRRLISHRGKVIPGSTGRSLFYHGGLSFLCTIPLQAPRRLYLNMLLDLLMNQENELTLVSIGHIHEWLQQTAAAASGQLLSVESCLLPTAPPKTIGLHARVQSGAAAELESFRKQDLQVMVFGFTH